jgi:geranylgeranyl pyrophosphate synthase
MESESKARSTILIKDFKERSVECRKYVIKSFLTEHIPHVGIQKALKHYFSYWNDYTHPGLFSIAYEACRGNSEDAVKPQAAMTMMAAAFDIHDDIVDKSKRKHNHTTVYGEFGSDISLLLGNAFLVKGLTLLGDSITELSNENQREIFKVIKESFFEVGLAHALELQTRGRLDVFPEEYFRILEMKAAGIQVDTHIAALIARGTEREVETLKDYGRIIGILATLREEFVDVFEAEELNRRLRKETLPLPLIFSLQDPKLKERILRILGKRITSKDIDELVSVVFDTKPVRIVKKKMEKLCEEAKVLASHTENRKSQELLSNLASSMLEDL